MKHLRNASLVFALTLVGWALSAILVLAYAVYIVARLSFSFFAANGMISHEEVYEALYIQVFSLEPIFFFMLLLGISGVGIAAFIFSNSQFNYFRSLLDAVKDFAYSGDASKAKNLGPFADHFANFAEVISLRLEKKGDEQIRGAIDKAELTWPKKPEVSWSDQIQFAIVSTLIAVFFAVLAIIFFWKVSDRIIDLSGALIRYKTSSGPMFFNTQADIVSLIMWTVFTFMIFAFAITGFRFGKRISDASYAVLRDLRKFMHGDYDHRVFLRGYDPAAILVPQINEALKKIADKIRS